MNAVSCTLIARRFNDCKICEGAVCPEQYVQASSNARKTSVHMQVGWGTTQDPITTMGNTLVGMVPPQEGAQPDDAMNFVEMQLDSLADAEVLGGFVLLGAQERRRGCALFVFLCFFVSLRSLRVYRMPALHACWAQRYAFPR